MRFVYRRKMEEVKIPLYVLQVLAGGATADA